MKSIQRTILSAVSMLLMISCTPDNNNALPENELINKHDTIGQNNNAVDSIINNTSPFTSTWFTAPEDISNEICFWDGSLHSIKEATTAKDSFALSFGVGQMKSAVWNYIGGSEVSHRFAAWTKKSSHTLDSVQTVILASQTNLPIGYRLGLSIIPVGIKAEAKVYADKTLFGLPQGTNISQYVLIDCPHDRASVVVTYPDFQYAFDFIRTPGPKPFDDVFKIGNALSGQCGQEYTMIFSSIPLESYDEITISIEIPIETEYFQKLFAENDYPEELYAKGIVERNENRVLEGSIKIKDFISKSHN